jgi:hypothetical protein
VGSKVGDAVGDCAEFDASVLSMNSLFGCPCPTRTAVGADVGVPVGKAVGDAVGSCHYRVFCEPLCGFSVSIRSLPVLPTDGSQSSNLSEAEALTYRRGVGSGVSGGQGRGLSRQHCRPGSGSPRRQRRGGRRGHLPDIRKMHR